MNVYKSIYNRYKLLLLFFCGLECCQTFLGNGRLNIMNGILKVCKCKDIVWIEPPCSIANKLEHTQKTKLSVASVWNVWNTWYQQHMPFCWLCCIVLLDDVLPVLLAMSLIVYYLWQVCCRQMGCGGTTGSCFYAPKYLCFLVKCIWYVEPVELGNLQKRVRRNPTTWLQGAPRSKSCSRIFSRSFTSDFEAKNCVTHLSCQ